MGTRSIFEVVLIMGEMAFGHLFFRESNKVLADSSYRKCDGSDLFESNALLNLEESTQPRMLFHKIPLVLLPL